METGDLPYLVRPMKPSDIEKVMEIEQASFPTPWPASAYRYELRRNDMAHYLVAESRESLLGEDFSGGERGLGTKLRQLVSRASFPTSIVGYGGFWLMEREAHIGTIAVKPEYRGRGIGELLLATMVEEAVELGAEVMTLEVRVSNHVAQKLYHKYGFAQVGLRRRYYSDNQEDALTMSTDPLTTPYFQTKFRDLKTLLREKLKASAGRAVRSEITSGDGSEGETVQKPAS